jgi:hypothetical protein
VGKSANPDSITVYSWEAAMLAEIYLLRLETLMRASEEATLAENFRFVPLILLLYETYR